MRSNSRLVCLGSNTSCLIQHLLNSHRLLTALCLLPHLASGLLKGIHFRNIQDAGRTGADRCFGII